MSNVSDLVQALRAAQKLAEKAIERTALARAEIEKAEQRFRVTVRGSGRPEALAAPARWAAATDHLDRIIGRLLTGTRAVDQYISVILGGGGASGIAAVGQAPSAPAEVSTGTDTGSRAEQFRRNVVRSGGDVVDATKTGVELFRAGVAAPRGEGSAPATRAATAAEPTPQGIPSAPDIVTGLVVGTIVAVEGLRATWRRLREQREEKKREHDEQ